MCDISRMAARYVVGGFVWRAGADRRVIIFGASGTEFGRENAVRDAEGSSRAVGHRRGDVVLMSNAFGTARTFIRHTYYWCEIVLAYVKTTQSCSAYLTHTRLVWSCVELRADPPRAVRQSYCGGPK